MSSNAADSVGTSYSREHDSRGSSSQYMPSCVTRRRMPLSSLSGHGFASVASLCKKFTGRDAKMKISLLTVCKIQVETVPVISSSIVTNILTGPRQAVVGPTVASAVDVCSPRLFVTRPGTRLCEVKCTRMPVFQIKHNVA